MITSHAGRIEIPSMKYIKVRWRHQLADEPVEFSHELDEHGWELRRIEIVAGGHAAVAQRHDQTGWRLSIEPLPDIRDINADPQFFASAINSEVFEQLWQQDATTGR
jgi:hypothetical protein